MRDLYKRLELSPNASQGELNAAIDNCRNIALKADAEAVLQVSSRRDEYDTLRATLCDIGLLRARLGLTHGAYWRDSVANDFSLSPDNVCSRHDELLQRLGHAARWHNRWRQWQGPCLLAGLFALGLALGLGIAGLIG